MRLPSILCLATLLYAAPSFSIGPSLDRCIRQPPASWASCLEQLDKHDLGAADLSPLDERIAEDPRSALEFLRLLESSIRQDGRALSDDPELHARLLDRQSEAYRLLGDDERSAAQAIAALEADPGDRALTWRSASGEPRWSVVLDTNVPRHERAARARLDQGRVKEARAILATVLRQGAVGEAESLWTASGGGPVSGLDPDPLPIHARPWYPRLPPTRVPLVGGEILSLADLQGGVLILSFWASWCTPCLKELPALAELYESEKDRGLQVVLINVGEEPDHALRFARDLGLEMPVGVYDDELEEAFEAASLPTMIVADRNGRVRARWDQYGEGVLQDVAALARRLMEPEAYGPGEQLGRSLHGGDLLHEEWVRIAKGGIDSLEFSRSEEPSRAGSLIAVAGRYVLSYDWRGVVTSFVDRPAGTGLLRGGDLSGAGRDDLFSFRRGGTRITRLDLQGGEHATWESPAPLLDLTIVPPEDGGEGAFFLSTTSGLFRMAPDGQTTLVGGLPDPGGLATLGGAKGSRVVAISRDRGLCILDPAGTAEVRCSASRARGVVAGRSASGMAGVPLGAAAITGRILGGEEGEVAAITSTGQLVILDIATGEERYRAHLNGMRALAAGDLDGNGVDELAVALEEHILVLAAGRAPAENEAPASKNGHK